MRKVQMYGLSWAGVFCACAVALGQAQVDQPRTTDRPDAATSTATASQSQADQEIAAYLLAGAKKEIELSKLGQQQAQHEAVKEFAGKMVKEHTQQAEKLARISGTRQSGSLTQSDSGTSTQRSEVSSQPGGQTPRQEAREEARDAREQGREEAREQARDSRTDAREQVTESREQRQESRRETGADSRPEGAEARRIAAGSTAGQGLDWVSVQQQIAKQCLESAKKELASKQGAEFDKCFMGMQVAGHMVMLDQLQVFRQHAQGALQQDIEQSISMTEQHLAEARQIMDQVKDTDSSTRSSSSPQGTNPQGTNPQGSNPQSAPSPGSQSPGSNN
ncbi:MAG: DUF4142 domain-containing protein [Pirellulaceae bacterium]